MSCLRIRSIAGLATIQDDGRRGHMHAGVPPSGALAPRLFARANAAVGNDGAAAIEIQGRLVIEAMTDCIVATDDGASVALARGASFTVDPIGARRVRYLAIAGGIDVPLVMGSRSTLLVAGLGGFEGRALRRGDELARLDAQKPTRDPGPIETCARFRVIRGPDAEGFEALLQNTFQISPMSDRIGTRLLGPKLPARTRGRSAPMVRGAIEVPPSGEAIVLGPDHPTLGGYPIVAVLVAEAIDAFFEVPPSRVVSFIG